MAQVHVEVAPTIYATTTLTWSLPGAPAGTRYDVTFAKVAIAADGTRSYGPEQTWYVGTSATEGTFTGGYDDVYEVRVVGVLPDGSRSARAAVTFQLAPAPADITGVGADPSWYAVPHRDYLFGTALVTYTNKARWTTTVTLKEAGTIDVRGTRLPQGAKGLILVDGKPAGGLDAAGAVRYQAGLGYANIPAGTHTVTIEAQTSPGHTVLALDAYHLMDPGTRLK